MQSQHVANKSANAVNAGFAWVSGYYQYHTNYAGRSCFLDV